MEITYIGLSECYREIIDRAQKSDYIWIMSLIARYADCENVYKKIEHDWESLNDLTGKKILFIFSSPSCKEWSSFFRKKGGKSYVGNGCPFITILDKARIDDNKGGFNYNYPNYENIDWKLKHSQTISEFAQNYNIPEEQIPCLFFYNVRNRKTKIVPLKSNIDIYKLVKKIIICINDLYDRILTIESDLKEFQNVENYVNLFIKLFDKAELLDITQKRAIQAVLTNKKMYLDVRDVIKDRQIQKDLKRIKQWDRQFFAAFIRNSKKQKEYLCLKKEYAFLSEMIDKKMDDIDLDSCTINDNEVKGMGENSNVNIFLSYSWKNDSQANDIYEYFKAKQGIEIHRDKIDVGIWDSIKEYMDSIAEMDFIIILISDDYLKSMNCMYEVMEVMRSKLYEKKIFPVVINKDIYEPIHRAKYIKYWTNKYNELKDELNGIQYDAIGKLGNDLKKIGDIKNNIGDFLDIISNMNNPEIVDVNEEIEKKLLEEGVICEMNFNECNLEECKEAYKELSDLVPAGMIPLLSELEETLKNNKN
ncbi:MAG: toll/interleukin-1 receptor domain-containing protein [Lachnospiraceae bacterium]|nr:toll/interleukin-1 receptor domain-containing protein [Lachnospiraceae bacterium]